MTRRRSKRAVGDAQTQAARISNLYQVAQGKPLWEKEILKRTLRKIENGDGIGPYLLDPLAQVLLDLRYISVDFTKDDPVKVTAGGKVYAGIWKSCDTSCGPGDYCPGGRCDREGCRQAAIPPGGRLEALLESPPFQ